jgi:hypothetical protein
MPISSPRPRTSRISGLDGLQPGQEGFAEAGGALGQALVGEEAQGFVGDGGGERVAAEGGAVVARAEDLHQRVVGQEGRHRQQPAAEGLAEDHPVGAHALVLAGEQAAGAAEAGLHLVGDQQHVVLAADFGAAGEPAGGRDHDAAFALDGFEQEGRGVGGDGCLEGRGVAVGDAAEARREGAEAVAVLGLGREADDGGGAAVEVVGADDDLGLAVGHALELVGPLAGGLDGGLDGFEAGVHRQRRS